MKKLYTLFIALIASIGTIMAVTIDGIAYSLNEYDSTAAVRSGGRYYGEVIIPSSVTFENVTYRVTSIGTYAFSGCSSLTSITIPNSVTSIGNLTFHGCSGLTSITIPNSVTSIGNYAFQECTGLKSITIPNNVTSIGWYAFSGCSALTSVTWNAKNCSVSSPGEYAPFYDIRGNITSFNFGEEVETIPAFLCYGMNKLVSVTIPNSVTSIGNNAFDGCSAMTCLSLGVNITSYGNSAFAGCSALTSIYNYRELPAKLGENTFVGVDYINCTLYVLAESIDLYKSTDSDWKDFFLIEAIAAQDTMTNGLTIDPGDNFAVFTWPIENNADTYSLQITKDDEVVSSLTFDASGQLTEIAFAPIKNGNKHATADTTTSNGMQFTVTGLNAATKYAYALNVKDTNDNVIQNYSGFFATNGYVAEKFTIKFVNWDGTELQSSKVEEMKIPEYIGTTPIRPDDEQYTYTFAGWTPEIVAVVADATYTATFTAIPKTQAIDNPSAKFGESQKLLINGQILILRDDKTYTLTGQEVK